MRDTLPAGIVDEVEALKREAGIAACSFVKGGMTLGLGTGSTVRYTVLELGANQGRWRGPDSGEEGGCRIRGHGRGGG